LPRGRIHGHRMGRASREWKGANGGNDFVRAEPRPGGKCHVMSDSSVPDVGTATRRTRAASMRDAPGTGYNFRILDSFGPPCAPERRCRGFSCPQRVGDCPWTLSPEPQLACMRPSPRPASFDSRDAGLAQGRQALRLAGRRDCAARVPDETRSVRGRGSAWHRWNGRGLSRAGHEARPRRRAEDPPRGGRVPEVRRSHGLVRRAGGGSEAANGPRARHPARFVRGHGLAG
jgi:hypothetical protein